MLDAVEGDDCRAAAIAFATAEPLGATSGRNPAEFHVPTFRKSPYRYQICCNIGWACQQVADPYFPLKSKRSSHRRHPKRSTKRFSQQLTSVTHSARGEQLLPPAELPADFGLDRAPIKQSNVDFSPRYDLGPEFVATSCLIDRVGTMSRTIGILAAGG